MKKKLWPDEIYQLYSNLSATSGKGTRTYTVLHAERKITSGQRSISVQTTRRSGQRQCHADNMSGHGVAPANAISMAFGASIMYIAYILYVATPCASALDRNRAS